MVGAGGFEPPASATRMLRASQAALRSDRFSFQTTNYIDLFF